MMFSHDEESDHECNDDCVVGVEMTEDGPHMVTRGELKDRYAKRDMEAAERSMTRSRFVQSIVDDEDMLTSIVDLFSNILSSGDPDTIIRRTAFFEGLFQGAYMVKYGFAKMEQEREEALTKMAEDIVGSMSNADEQAGTEKEVAPNMAGRSRHEVPVSEDACSDHYHCDSCVALHGLYHEPDCTFIVGYSTPTNPHSQSEGGWSYREEVWRQGEDETTDQEK